MIHRGSYHRCRFKASCYTELFCDMKSTRDAELATVLDSEAETARKESAQEMPRVQKVSGIGICNSSSRKSASYPHSRYQRLSSHRSRLCWTTEISSQEKTRRGSICSPIFLQPHQRSYLDLMPNLETAAFLRSLKKFIDRRGRPERIYSDNGRTFVRAAKWIREVMKDERLHNYLSTKKIKWQFNLSRAPWWGRGQFEKMIGLVKSALNKTIGFGFLQWNELQELLLDVEITLNNRPLSYLENDVQLPVLTSNSQLFLNSNLLPNLELHRIETAELRKRANTC